MASDGGESGRYHTGAEVEAEERGLVDELHEFARPPAELLDLLTAADMTTSPDGEPIEPELHVGEILVRYESQDEVHRAVSRSAPSLLAAVARVRARMASVDEGQPTWG